jgi:hypothetical protein
VYILPFENKKSKELLARRNPRRYFATAATLILRAPPAIASNDQLSTIDDHLRRTQGGGEFRATDKVIQKPLVF